MPLTGGSHAAPGKQGRRDECGPLIFPRMHPDLKWKAREEPWIRNMTGQRGKAERRLQGSAGNSSYISSVKSLPLTVHLFTKERAGSAVPSGDVVGPVAPKASKELHLHVGRTYSISGRCSALQGHPAPLRRSSQRNDARPSARLPSTPLRELLLSLHDVHRNGAQRVRPHRLTADW